MRSYGELRAAVFDTIATRETARAIATIEATCERDLGLIRATCECAGARVAPVAAYFGYLPRIRYPEELIDVTQPHPGIALACGDVEALCMFSLFRAARPLIRAEVIVIHPDHYEPRPTPPAPITTSCGRHPHARDDD